MACTFWQRFCSCYLSPFSTLPLSTNSQESCSSEPTAIEGSNFAFEKLPEGHGVPWLGTLNRSDSKFHGRLKAEERHRLLAQVHQALICGRPAVVIDASLSDCVCESPSIFRGHRRSLGVHTNCLFCPSAGGLSRTLIHINPLAPSKLALDNRSLI